MASTSAVDRQYEESRAALDAIPENQPSLRSSASDLFRKSLLLAAASYFEHRLTTCVLDYVNELVQGAPKIVALVQAKVISRQYHTWFQWDASNANAFFGLFGKDFKDAMTAKVKGDVGLERSIKSFLELGGNRNSMVHVDFSTYPLDKTLDEIYESYKTALHFVDGLADLLRRHP
ncbi:MAG TPA: HEPN domain-containing protein [Dyella sp.]|uniref:HEPN domain-containing protein n=1 Tax=Dyella sp. TaxID=1869338 RepID=UPI002F923A77